MLPSLDWLEALARYNRWMNVRLYGVAAKLSDDARKRDVGAFFKSIQARSTISCSPTVSGWRA